jgi:phosphoglycerate dehydrogenase-like enzyme
MSSSATFVVTTVEQYGQESVGEVTCESLEQAERMRSEYAAELRQQGWQWNGEDGVFENGPEYVCLEVREEGCG